MIPYCTAGSAVAGVGTPTTPTAMAASATRSHFVRLFMCPLRLTELRSYRPSASRSRILDHYHRWDTGSLCLLGTTVKDQRADTTFP